MKDNSVDLFAGILDPEDMAFAKSSPVKKAAQPVKKVAAAAPKRAAPPPEEKPEPVVDPETLAPQASKHKGSAAHKAVEAIEKRFLEVAGLKGDLSVFPADQSNHLQVKTNKEKSDKHGEVFTPLWLVDQMVEHADAHELRNQDATTMDLCSGYGQFSVRLMRYKLNLMGDKFKVDKFLGETHAFVELQPSSCYRLIYVFGTGIRLCIGDAARMGELPDSAEKGIWVWCQAHKSWKDMTARVQRKVQSLNGGKHAGKSIGQKAEAFEDWFEALQERAAAKGCRGGDDTVS